VTRRRGDVRGQGPVKVGAIVGDYLERAGVRVQVERNGVLEVWPERVGQAIAEVTHARGLSEGTLFVEVRSSAWLMELNMMRADILRRLNEGRESAPIERIVFVQSGEPESV
jgi:predicted nucleic acid-binding Zn ribbon protein